jgi:radical SAM protein with 4Fe4S-binding SPASM domain
MASNEATDRSEPYHENPLPEDLHRFAIPYAQIQTHSVCNARCTCCPYQTGTHQTLPQGRMEWNLFTKVIDELATVPTLEEVAPFLQNEPLLDERLPDAIRHIKHVLPHVRTTLNTNGSSLVPSMLERLADAGLDHITFSLNALTEETFERVQSRLSFDTVTSNLRHLIENKPDSLAVTVMSLVVRASAMEFAFPKRFSDLPDLMERAGIEYRINSICNRAGALDGWEDLAVFEHTNHLYHNLYCHDLFENIEILFSGEVIACCNDWARETVMGNLADQTLAEVWNSDVARTRREKAAAGRYRDMPGCRDCSQAWNIEKNLDLRSTQRDPETERPPREILPVTGQSTEH